MAEENWPAVKLFIAMETQWRVVSLSGFAGAEIVYQGLDYAALAVVAKAMGTELNETVLGNLRTMEIEAVKALGEARKRRAQAKSSKAKAQKRIRR